MRYLLSPEAESDLDDIWNYTTETWSGAQADKYILDIISDIENVALGVRQGRGCDDIRQGYFKLLSGSHVVFFKLRGETMDIVRILHQRMDFNRRLGDAT